VNTYTNNTGNWAIVGNRCELISTHATAGEAELALADFEIEESAWGTLDILAPGASISGNFTSGEPLPDWSVNGRDCLTDLVGF
jgi:hypothetical protein